MISYHDLLNADFAPLRTATDSWIRVPNELLGAGGPRQEFGKVTAGLTDGSWQGHAADAAQPVMSAVCTEIDRAADEATNIAKLLADAYTRFTDSQHALKHLVGEVTSENSAFAVNDSGTVTPRPGGDPRLAASAQQSADGYNSSIRQILHDVTETDRTLRWALRDDTDGAKDQGFSDAEFSTVADAGAAHTKALRDARTAVDLAKTHPLSHDDARRLDALLAAHTGDPAFGAAFATGLGADGTLTFWTSNANTFGEHQIGRTTLASLQCDLGYTLAAATHEHTPAMAQWQQQMVAAATHPVGRGVSPLGCQVMSNLMRTGDYDKGFLAPYGHTVLKFDEAGKGISTLWGTDTGLNYLDGSSGDPLEGYMDALDHNPAYATTFLSEHGTLDHLAGRTWFDQQTSFGHALLAGTTGRPAGTPPDVAFPSHTPAEAALMNSATHCFAQDVSAPVAGGLAPSLGQMAGEYLPDYNRVIYGGVPSAGTSPDLGTRLFPSGGAPLDPSKIDATRFLYRLGESPDSFAAVSLAQTRYTSGALLYHAHHQSEIGIPYSQQITDIVTPGNAIQTIVNHGALDNKVSSAAARDTAYNQSLAAHGEWAKAGIGFGAGLTEGVPFVGGVIGTVIETGGGNAVDSYVNGHQQDTTGAAGYAGGTSLFANTSQYQNSVYQGAMSAGIVQQAQENGDTFTDRYNKAFRDSEDYGQSLLNDANCR